jgi:hypothetical protein
MIGATDRGREADPTEPGPAEAEQHRTRPYHGHSAPEEGQATQVRDLPPPPPPMCQISIKTPNPKCRLFLKIYQ